MDALEIAAMLGGVAIGLLGVVYLINLLGFVIRGGGLGIAEAVVKVVLITVLGAGSWELLGLAGVL